MVLIKNGAAVADPWVTVGDDASLPNGPTIVTLHRWLAERDRLIMRNAPLGVRIESGQSPAEIATDLDRLAVVALAFPVFTDGRPFSTARQLRDQYGYKGETRAVGDVLRDQILFMVRCGFDAFEMNSDDSAVDWRAAVAEIEVFYQTAADNRPSAMESRHVRTNVSEPARDNYYP